MAKCSICDGEYTERGMARHMATHRSESSPVDEALGILWPDGVPIEKIDTAARLRNAMRAALAD